MPDIPDFAAAAWQARRSDAQLLVSILDGKGKYMPPFGGKINKDQASDLVAHVRAFAPTKGKPGAQKHKEAPSLSDFEKEFRRLQEEMANLQKQFSQVPEVGPDWKPSKPSKAAQHTADTEPSESQPHASPRKSAPAPTGMFGGRELFRPTARNAMARTAPAARHGAASPETVTLGVLARNIGGQLSSRGQAARRSFQSKGESYAHLVSQSPANL
jgi:hypothetical protein